MQAVKFKEQNEEIGNGLPGYYNVPVYKCENATGDLIMKIRMTKEEWEQIGKNDFSFYYTRQTGGRGLQPFSFQVETPFSKCHTIMDLSPSGLESFLQEGSRIGNFHVSSDVALFEVIAVIQGGVSLKRFDVGNETIATRIYSFKDLSDMLVASNYNADFFVVNPKQGG